MLFPLFFIVHPIPTCIFGKHRLVITAMVISDEGAALTTGCTWKDPWRMNMVKWVNVALTDACFSSLGLLFPCI